jgi:hypothetical protein
MPENNTPLTNENIIMILNTLEEGETHFTILSLKDEAEAFDIQAGIRFYFVNEHGVLNGQVESTTDTELEGENIVIRINTTPEPDGTHKWKLFRGYTIYFNTQDEKFEIKEIKKKNED